MWSQVDVKLLLAWFAILVAFTVVRLMHVRLVLSSDAVSQNVRTTKRIFIVSAFLSGAIWGAGFMVFGWQTDDSYRLLYLLVLGGMASGAVSPMAGSRSVYAAYLLPILSPAILLLFLQGNAVGYASGAMILMFMLMLLITHHAASHSLTERLRLGFENESLIDELSSTNRQLLAAEEELRIISLTDALTGLANRRYFNQIFEREWARAQRSEQPISCLMIDIDLFKNYNDHYGHQRGDICLQAVAHALKRAVRRQLDMIARYGGEEFVAILPDTTVEGATLLARQMMDNVREADIDHIKTAEGKVTISIGVATFTSTDMKKMDDLLKAADDALYEAKSEGRNRMVIDSQ